MRRSWLFALIGAGLVAWAMPAHGDEPEVKEGDKAPAIELPAVNADKALPDQKDAKTLNLKDFQGKKNVVLFFFPKAMTKG